MQGSYYRLLKAFKDQNPSEFDDFTEDDFKKIYMPESISPVILAGTFTVSDMRKKEAAL